MTTPSSTSTESSAPPLLLVKRLSQLMVLTLIALYTATSLLDEKILWTVLLVPCVSIGMFLPGMFNDHARSYDWLCFVILIHFTVAVTNIMSPTPEWNDYVQTLLTSALFICSMMASRWQKASQQPRPNG